MIEGLDAAREPGPEQPQPPPARSGRSAAAPGAGPRRTQTTTAREARLTAAFVTLADTIVSAFDLTEFLQTMAATCVDLFEVDAAGLMLANPAGRLRLVASSNEAARVVEMAQLAADAGPCLESFAMSKPVAIPDIETTRARWPAFVEVARASGLRSSYATPMRVREQTIGTINLFSARLEALDADDLSAAQALTDVATIGILQERLVREARTTADQLQTALQTRIVVEQAKGVLATSSGLSIGDAFLAMRRYSRSTNTRLQEVARGIIDHTIDLGLDP